MSKTKKKVDTSKEDVEIEVKEVITDSSNEKVNETKSEPVKDEALGDKDSPKASGTSGLQQTPSTNAPVDNEMTHSTYPLRAASEELKNKEGVTTSEIQENAEIAMSAESGNIAKAFNKTKKPTPAAIPSTTSFDLASQGMAVTGVIGGKLHRAMIRNSYMLSADVPLAPYGTTISYETVLALLPKESFRFQVPSKLPHFYGFKYKLAKVGTPHLESNDLTNDVWLSTYKYLEKAKCFYEPIDYAAYTIDFTEMGFDLYIDNTASTIEEQFKFESLFKKYGLTQLRNVHDLARNEQEGKETSIRTEGSNVTELRVIFLELLLLILKRSVDGPWLFTVDDHRIVEPTDGSSSVPVAISHISTSTVIDDVERYPFYPEAFIKHKLDTLRAKYTNEYSAKLGHFGKTTSINAPSGIDRLYETYIANFDEVCYQLNENGWDYLKQIKWDPYDYVQFVNSRILHEGILTLMPGVVISQYAYRDVMIRTNELNLIYSEFTPELISGFANCALRYPRIMEILFKMMEENVSASIEDSYVGAVTESVNFLRSSNDGRAKETLSTRLDPALDEVFRSVDKKMVSRLIVEDLFAQNINAAPSDINYNKSATAFQFYFRMLAIKLREMLYPNMMAWNRHVQAFDVHQFMRDFFINHLMSFDATYGIGKKDDGSIVHNLSEMLKVRSECILATFSILDVELPSRERDNVLFNQVLKFLRQTPTMIIDSAIPSSPYVLKQKSMLLPCAPGYTESAASVKDAIALMMVRIHELTLAYVNTKSDSMSRQMINNIHSRFLMMLDPIARTLEAIISFNMLKNGNHPLCFWNPRRGNSDYRSIFRVHCGATTAIFNFDQAAQHDSYLRPDSAAAYSLPTVGHAISVFCSLRYPGINYSGTIGDNFDKNLDLERMARYFNQPYGEEFVNQASSMYAAFRPVVMGLMNFEKFVTRQYAFKGLWADAFESFVENTVLTREKTIITLRTLFGCSDETMQKIGDTFRNQYIQGKLLTPMIYFGTPFSETHEPAYDLGSLPEYVVSNANILMDRIENYLCMRTAFFGANDELYSVDQTIGNTPAGLTIAFVKPSPLSANNPMRQYNESNLDTTVYVYSFKIYVEHVNESLDVIVNNGRVLSENTPSIEVSVRTVTELKTILGRMGPDVYPLVPVYSRTKISIMMERFLAELRMRDGVYTYCEQGQVVRVCPMPPDNVSNFESIVESDVINVRALSYARDPDVIISTTMPYTSRYVCSQSQAQMNAIQPILHKFIRPYPLVSFEDVFFMYGYNHRLGQGEMDYTFPSHEDFAIDEDHKKKSKIRNKVILFSTKQWKTFTKFTLART